MYVYIVENILHIELYMYYMYVCMYVCMYVYRGAAQVVLEVNYLPANTDLRCRFDPWVRKSPWRRRWQPTPVFLPGKSDGWRSLAVYRLWGLKESDTSIGTQHVHVYRNFCPAFLILYIKCFESVLLTRSQKAGEKIVRN